MELSYETIRSDFDKLIKSGEKSNRLDMLGNALLSIPPTSVEAEGAFTTVALFITKIRSS